ncbi:MAG: hypothetical protein HQL24_03645 [Candidatus Omnitrophica bacterium]|nr:hypothetical protein [Candidatus Omnitrophota bacterium]
MELPLQLNFKGWKDDGEITNLINEKIAKLERLCHHVISCHIAIEQLPTAQQTGHSYHIRIDVRIPPHHEIVVVREPQKGTRSHTPLSTLLRDAFEVVFRQGQEIVNKQHGQIKAHSREKQTPKILRQNQESEEISE